MSTARRTLRILAVQENRVNQRLLVQLLKKEGHQITLVEDGQAAVTLSAEQRFSIILMDLQMPKLNGTAATRQIRKRETGTGEHVPIVALTAHAMKGDREKCLAAGMDCFIANPLHKQELLDVLEEFASSKEITPERGQPNSPPVLDAEVALRQTGGNEQSRRELCRIFLIESPALLRELSNSLQENKMDDVRLIAQKLRALADTIGATRACAAAATEQSARAHQDQSVEIHGRALEREIAFLRNAAAEFLCTI